MKPSIDNIKLLQRLIQSELIFRLLLKVTVDWPRECNLIPIYEGVSQREIPRSVSKVFTCRVKFKSSDSYITLFVIKSSNKYAENQHNLMDP